METQPKKKQVMRYSEEEISLIKNTFKEEEMLKEIRKQFLQFPSALTLSPDAIKVLKKTLLPVIEPDAPMWQVTDMWLSLNIRERSPEDALLIIKARKLLMDYYEQEFEVLEGKKKERKIKLEDLVEVTDDANDMLIRLTARNEIVTHLEQQLAQLSVLAIQDTQKLVDDMLKNSAK
jgi:hypothetical protein